MTVYSLTLAKKGQTMGPGQSLFSLSLSRERSEFSDIFLNFSKRSTISEKRLFVGKYS